MRCQAAAKLRPFDYMLRRGVAGYSEAQGKGFICWRFVNEHMR